MENSHSGEVRGWWEGGEGEREERWADGWGEVKLEWVPLQGTGFYPKWNIKP